MFLTYVQYIHILIFYSSHSDLYVPVTSLTRMVRVYSRPWDEKSATLKKIKKDQERFIRCLLLFESVSLFLVLKCISVG